MGYKTVEVPIPLYHHRVWDGRSLTPPAPDQPYEEAAAYTEKLLNLTPPEGRNVGMVLEGREIYFSRTPHTRFTAADKAEWARLERIIEGLKVADEVLARPVHIPARQAGHFQHPATELPAGPIYVIAPNWRQAVYWLEVAGIPPERVQYAGSRFENLRGLAHGTTVYRVGGELSDRQFHDYRHWIQERFRVIVGLPGLRPELERQMG